MEKSPEAFRTISEVAELLETPAHVLRFWESRFPQIRPVKRAGGRRYYRPTDVALLSGIRLLLHDHGMTIRGVQKILREQGVRHVCALGADASLMAEASAEWAGDEAVAAAILDAVAVDPVPDDRVIPWPGQRAAAPAQGEPDAPDDESQPAGEASLAPEPDAADAAAPALAAEQDPADPAETEPEQDVMEGAAPVEPEPLDDPQPQADIAADPEPESAATLAVDPEPGLSDGVGVDDIVFASSHRADEPTGRGGDDPAPDDPMTDPSPAEGSDPSDQSGAEADPPPADSAAQSGAPDEPEPDKMAIPEPAAQRRQGPPDDAPDLPLFLYRPAEPAPAPAVAAPPAGRPAPAVQDGSDALAPRHDLRIMALALRRADPQALDPAALHALRDQAVALRQRLSRPVGFP